MFSQRDEELHILNHFKNYKGRLLDIGAFDGKTFSNTRRLLMEGWRGVLVEPSPCVLPSLKALYKNSKKVEIVEKGIGIKEGTFKFYEFGGDAVGSFDLDHATLWEENGKRKYTEIDLEVITLNQLLDEHGNNFDFINLDAEGWSVDILKNLPWSRLYQCRLICVEYDRSEDVIMRICQKQGFSLIYKSAENLLMGK